MVSVFSLALMNFNKLWTSLARAILRVLQNCASLLFKQHKDLRKSRHLYFKRCFKLKLSKFHICTCLVFLINMNIPFSREHFSNAGWMHFSHSAFFKILILTTYFCIYLSGEIFLHISTETLNLYSFPMLWLGISFSTYYMVLSFLNSDLGETTEKMLQALLRNGTSVFEPCFPSFLK